MKTAGRYIACASLAAVLLQPCRASETWSCSIAVVIAPKVDGVAASPPMTLPFKYQLESGEVRELSDNVVYRVLERTDFGVVATYARVLHTIPNGLLNSDYIATDTLTLNRKTGEVVRSQISLGPTFRVATEDKGTCKLEVE